jgi:hypothetical protein
MNPHDVPMRTIGRRVSLPNIVWQLESGMQLYINI